MTRVSCLSLASLQPVACRSRCGCTGKPRMRRSETMCCDPCIIVGFMAGGAGGKGVHHRGCQIMLKVTPRHHHQEEQVESWAISTTEHPVHAVLQWWVRLCQCRTHLAREALHRGEDVIDSLRHE